MANESRKCLMMSKIDWKILRRWLKESWDEFGPVRGWLFPFRFQSHPFAFHALLVIKVIAKCFPQTSDAEFEITDCVSGRLSLGCGKGFRTFVEEWFDWDGAGIGDLSTEHGPPDKLLNKCQIKALRHDFEDKSAELNQHFPPFKVSSLDIFFLIHLTDWKMIFSLRSLIGDCSELDSKAPEDFWRLFAFKSNSMLCVLSMKSKQVCTASSVFGVSQRGVYLRSHHKNTQASHFHRDQAVS